MAARVAGIQFPTRCEHAQYGESIGSGCLLAGGVGRPGSVQFDRSPITVTPSVPHVHADEPFESRRIVDIVTGGY